MSKMKDEKHQFEYNQDLTEDELMEMASLGKKSTGLDEVVIWVGPNPVSGILRIKVSNQPHGLTGKDCFTITLPDFEVIGEVNRDLITESIMQ
jgi:hypothetical protein